MLECVPNVSAGRDVDVIAGLAASCGTPLLDVHTDPDHNRSVFTLAAPDAGALTDAVQGLARAVASTRVDRGARRRPPSTRARSTSCRSSRSTGDPAAATHAAREFARWWSTSFAVPVFFYDGADTQHRSLPSARRDAFRRRVPDLGPAQPHPDLGATAVGARAPLVAINCLLDTADVEVARAPRRGWRGNGTADSPACAPSVSSSPRPGAPRSR